MPKITVKTILDLYRKATILFYEQNDLGPEKGLLGWSSKETQFKRFEVLLSLAQKELLLQTNDTVADVGCGFAAFLSYMQSLGLQYQYFGMDSNPSYIQEAKRRFPQMQFSVIDVLDIKLGTISQIYDVVFLSGLWNLDVSIYLQDEGERHIAKYAVIEFILSKMCTSAKKGVVCNFLHTDSKDQYPIFNYHDPKVLIDYFESKNFRVKAYRERYLENDFSVVFLPMSNVS